MSLRRRRDPVPTTQPMRRYREPATQPMDAWPDPGRYLDAPAYAAPPRVHQGTYGEWTGTMTINDDPASAADHTDDRYRKARAFIDLHVPYLESEGMGYRLDDAALNRERGEKIDGRTVIARAAREGAAHLLGLRTDWLTRNSDRPWAPPKAGGWAEEWIDRLPWYDPDARESEPWWNGREYGGAA